MQTGRLVTAGMPPPQSPSVVGSSSRPAPRPAGPENTARRSARDRACLVKRPRKFSRVHRRAQDASASFRRIATSSSAGSRSGCSYHWAAPRADVPEPGMPRNGDRHGWWYWMARVERPPMRSLRVDNGWTTGYVVTARSGESCVTLAPRNPKSSMHLRYPRVASSRSRWPHMMPTSSASRTPRAVRARAMLSS